MLFFRDNDGHFREFIGAIVAIIEEKRLFWVEEMEHVFKGLVVNDAVAPVLETNEVNRLVMVVDDGIFEV